jgi:hypothetical protein
MLIVKGNIYRNVTEKEAEYFKGLGYAEVVEKPKEAEVKPKEEAEKKAAKK